MERSEPTPHEADQADSLTDIREQAAEHGITATPEGLIIPSHDTEALDRKIAPSIAEAASRIEAAAKAGKDILYLPGSYDLLHLGHVSYLDQAITFHLSVQARAGRAISREDVFVVAMADSDELIAKLKAGKQLSRGGDEDFSRPVERGIDARGRSVRLDTLATLPVDLVGFLPAPIASSNQLPDVPPLNYNHARDVITPQTTPRVAEHVQQAINNYHNLESGAPAEAYPDWWSIGLWQVYLTAALVHDMPPQARPMTRLLSRHDGAYNEAVALYMDLAGVNVETFDDRHVISTSELLAKYGPEYLLASKR